MQVLVESHGVVNNLKPAPLFLYLHLPLLNSMVVWYGALKYNTLVSVTKPTPSCQKTKRSKQTAQPAKKKNPRRIWWRTKAAQTTYSRPPRYTQSLHINITIQKRTFFFRVGIAFLDGTSFFPPNFECVVIRRTPNRCLLRSFLKFSSRHLGFIFFRRLGCNKINNLQDLPNTIDVQTCAI